MGNVGNKNAGQDFSTSFKANSASNFWWQIMPFVFIFGLVAILLFLAHTGNDNVNALDTSLSAQTTGSFYALLLAGLLTIYFLKVVEPRIENDSSKKFLILNVELTVLIIETFLLKVQKHIQLSEQTWNAKNKVKYKYNYCSLKRKVSSNQYYSLILHPIKSALNFRPTPKSIHETD